MEESRQNELKKELDTVYQLIAALSVRGDAVDIIAVAREHLRRAYRLAETAAKEDKNA